MDNDANVRAALAKYREEGQAVHAFTRRRIEAIMRLPERDRVELCLWMLLALTNRIAKNEKLSGTKLAI